MTRALELAALGRGRTSPNPMVGAVVVRGGEIVGEGWHRRAGEPHAEVLALAAAGGKADGADLYVNLEPCVHHGRTPPCVGAILAAGIRRVWAAVPDPNPLVNGKGAASLREKGVAVDIGLMAVEAGRLNEVYLKHMATGLPFVTLKMALSLDGKLATRDGDARWITGEESRRAAHEMRAASDAVMVGVGTVLADDPLLNVRLPGWGEGRQPRRVVLDSLLRMPAASRMLRETPGIGTWVATTRHAPAERAKALEAAGAEVIVVPGRGRRVDLARLLRELGDRGVAGLLVEGGAGVFTAALAKGLADKVAAFIAPVIIGGRKAVSPVLGRGAGSMAEALRLGGVRAKVLGEDVLIEGYVHRPD